MMMMGSSSSSSTTKTTTMMVLFLFLFLQLVLFLCYCLHMESKKRKILCTVPSWHDWYIVGDVLHMPKRQTDWYNQMLENCEQHRADQMMKLSVGFGRYVVVLFGGEAVGELLRSTVLLTKGSGYKFLHPWLGTGLLTSDGQKWYNRRKMLTPSFHFNILEDFLVTMNEQANNLSDKLAEFTHKTVDIFPYITLNSLDIICATAMGVHLNALENAESEYVHSVYKVGELFALRTRKPWLQNDFFYYNIHPEGRLVRKSIDCMHRFTEKIISERQQSWNELGGEQNNRRKAFLDMLLNCKDENGQHLSAADIREEVDTFMFEGHDTTSSGTAFTLYALGANPRELLKCQEEQDLIFEYPREATVDDLRRMTYLEATIKEAMRLLPPVPGFSRTTSEDTKIGDHTIPKGTTLNVFTPALHMDPQVFPDPHKFNPTRFLAENMKQRHPYAYVPFSAGPRNCIGQKFAMMELKVIVSTIIRNFNITSVQSIEELGLFSALILKASQGIKVRLSHRT